MNSANIINLTSYIYSDIMKHKENISDIMTHNIMTYSGLPHVPWSIGYSSKTLSFLNGSPLFEVFTSMFIFDTYEYTYICRSVLMYALTLSLHPNPYFLILTRFIRP
jgi:hypothetical protein